MESEAIDPTVLSRLSVFPLPRTVLFPGTVLPLHIFEPRYRQLVTDALATHRVLGIVKLVEPESEADRAPENAPTVHRVGCLGEIIHADELPDGRYNILVQGIARVRLLEELSVEALYRRFRTELVSPPTEAETQRAAAEFARVQSCVVTLSASVESSDAQLAEVLRSTSDPLQLADILSAVVVGDPDAQQQLLETENLRTRLDLLTDSLADLLLRVTEPNPSQAN